MNDEFHAALEAADREMSDLLCQRIAIDERIKQLKATRDALAALLRPAADHKPSSTLEAAAMDTAALTLDELGITDAIRRILSESRTPLSPTEIEYRLAEGGIPLDKYANSLAVIHTTLKRLEKQGELLSVKDSSGKVFGYARQGRTGSS